MNRVIKNTTWIVACKIVQMALNLVVSMLTARYLGPANYGLINYASSIVTFLIPVMQLGLRSTLVSEFVNSPEKEGKILGTAIALNLAGALGCMVGIFSLVSVAATGEPETVLVCTLYSVSLLFQALEIVQYWFQAKLLSKYPSLAMVVSYVVVSAYKIFLLVTGKSVYWFAVSHAIDYALISLVLLCVYGKKGSQKLGFSFKLAGQMFRRSKYYIVSGLMVNVFMLTDRIMLKHMMGDEVTGYYSAAVVCAGMTSFVFNAIIDSARPGILEKSRKDESAFKNSVSSLFSIVIYLSLAQCVAITLLARPVVMILYGGDYVSSVGVLRLVVWYTSFSYLGTVRNIWILAKERQSILWGINLCGAASNVLLNLALIPLWGMNGAAAASIISQFFTNFVLTWCIPKVRECGGLMLKGLDVRGVLKYGVSLVKKKTGN